GQLTEKVRRRPYTVVLFDEIEKAHPEVFNVLLQVLENGRLTDAKGRTVDFRNTVIIMTSNVGAHEIQRHGSIGFRTVEDSQQSYQDMKKKVMDELRKTFRPEFLNRVDEVIVFHALTKEHLRQIVDIMLQTLVKELKDRGVQVEFTERAKDVLAEQGYDPQYGARPLRRATQRLVENPLSEEMLRGRFQEGDTIVVDANAEGQIVFEKKQLAEVK